MTIGIKPWFFLPTFILVTAGDPDFNFHIHPLTA